MALHWISIIMNLPSVFQGSVEKTKLYTISTENNKKSPAGFD